MLVEREDAIKQFSKAADKLSDGYGGIVLVSGESGIGKTSLLEEARQNSKHNFTFFWSGSDPLFTPRPFGPVHDIAAELSTELLDLLEGGASPSSIFAQFYAALEAAKQPIVLVFEDAHWADYATLDLFRFLARRIAFVNCLLVISYRDDEVDEKHPFRQVLDILPSGHTHRIPIAPLTEGGVELLAQGSGRDIAKLHEITAGNPFYITELLAIGTKISDVIPASVKEAINSRLAHLAEGERKFLETISLIPNSVSTELIDELRGPEGETFAMACVARKLLVIDSNEDFRFRHELARLGTLAGVSANKQKRLHIEILNALERCNQKDGLALLIHHSAGALDAKRVLKYAPSAASRAAKIGAHREAASYLATALRFVDEAETEVAAQLYEDWAYESGLALKIDDDVIEARRHAITLWRALGRKEKVSENLRWLSRLHWYRGEAAEAEHFANETIKILESIPKSSERAMAYSFRSQLDMLNDRMDEAVDWGNRALAIEEEYPNPEIRVHALNNVGSAMVLRGNEDGEALLMESLDLSLQHGFHEHAARVYTNFSDYCLRYKKIDVAEKMIAEGIAFDTSYDLDSWTYYLLGIQSYLRMEQGRLEDAETISMGVLGLEQLTLLMKLPALTVLARAQLRLGRSTYVDYLNQSLENSFATDELQYIIPARLGAIEAAWLRGNPDAAYAQLKWLSELAPSDMDHWRAGEMAEWVHRFSFDLKVESEFELPEPYQLELAGDYLAAAELWMSLGIPYNAALSLIHTDEQQAAEALPRAYRILDSIGAKATIAMVRDKAERFGILSKLPRARRGPYRKTRQHPAGLTAKEQEVLAHLVGGATNQDIAEVLSRSQRTVENHVSSILSKLNVANRMEAMLRVQNEPWLAANIDTLKQNQ